MRENWTDLAIILKRRNLNEADRVLVILTKKRGKLSVKAAGVRGPKSKRRSHVELFNTIRAQVITGKGMPILAQTDLIKDRSGIKSDLKLLRISYYLVELVEKLIPEGQPLWEVFELLDRALSSVDMEKWRDEGRLIRAFEERLLRLLGYGVPVGFDSLKLFIEEIINARLRSREILKDR